MALPKENKLDTVINTDRFDFERRDALNGRTLDDVLRHAYWGVIDLYYALEVLRVSGYNVSEELPNYPEEPFNPLHEIQTATIAVSGIALWAEFPWDTKYKPPYPFETPDYIPEPPPTIKEFTTKEEFEHYFDGEHF